MAIKFPKVRPENGEVMHPSDVLENIGEFVNECNGSIDSDNFSGAFEIPESSFKESCFHEIHTYHALVNSAADSDIFYCPSTTSAYAKTDDNNTKLAGVEIDATTDGWAVIDFNCTWMWTGNGITSVEMAEDLLFGYLLKEPDSGDNPLIAGSANLGRSDMPPGGWMGFCGERSDLDNPNRWASFAEKIETSVGDEIEDAIVSNFPLGQWSDVPVDFYAVQFRIVINGTVISESGPLFNGNWRNSVYLCGATPVVAGKNNIDVEVRAYTAVELKTSRVGVGARDSDGNRGEMFSYQPQSSEVHPLPLPKYEKNALDVGEALTKSGPSVLIDAGIKCDVLDRNLVVQFRKR